MSDGKPPVETGSQLANLGDAMPVKAFEAVSKFLDQQQRETELEAQKHSDNVELEKLRIQEQAKESERNYHHASKLLELQAIDLADGRKTEKSKMKISAVLIAALAVIVGIVLIIAFYTNQTAWMVEMAKILGGAAAGSSITYGIQKAKQAKQSSSPTDPDDSKN